MKSRILIALTLLALLLSGCISLAEDITPPPGYVPPTPVPTLGNLYPQAAPDLASGAAIFAEKCAPCHGDTGLGDGPQGKQLSVNVPGLGVPEIGRRSVPSEWYSVVTLGRIQKFMPPFASLSDQQRWDVVAYAYNLQTKPEQIEQGKALYAASCAQCHGEDGKLAPSADLSSQEQMAKLSQLDLYNFVKNGIAPAMPPSSLADDEIYAVAAYVRTFTFAQEAAPEPTATPVPATPTSAPTAAENGTPAADVTPAATVEGQPAATDAPTATALPAGFGSISGKVVNGSGGALPAGLTVTLRGYSHGQDPNAAPEEIVTLNLTPASDGSFTAEGVELGENRFFLAETEYEGVSYQSQVAVSEAGTTELTLPDLSFFDVTEDFKELSLNQLHLFFDPPTNSTINVYALYVFSNTSGKAIGIPMNDQQNIPFIKIPANALPNSIGYEDAGMGGSFLPYKDGGFAMMPSADAQYGIAATYTLPYNNSTVDLAQELAVTAKTISVLLPEGMKAEGDGITAGEIQSMQAGQSYQIFSSGELVAGKTLTVTVSGEPKAQPTDTSATDTTKPDNTQTLIIAAAAIGIVFIAAGLYLFWRDRNRDDEEDDEDDDEEDDDETSPEEVLDAIIALDEQYKSQNISEEAYQKRRAELKARLKSKV
jgi:mono/diheme cytochrome c family protein